MEVSPRKVNSPRNDEATGRNEEAHGFCEETPGKPLGLSHEVHEPKLGTEVSGKPGKQEPGYKDDSDYVRDSTETNSSGGSSSTSGYVPTKLRRAHRAIRSKNAGPTELRRNPVRVKKKEIIGRSFSRPRQRLLSAKRNAAPADLGAGKRPKFSTMPYMNTRSVTRKMYNVGATHQAPTKRDETEWKEWPVHGMHERPVYHPQVGLAVEYLGRYFTSLDGLSYHEIIDRPEIEVVSVDPHCEFLSSNEKKRRKNRQTRAGSEKDSGRFREESESFERCMHGSLHCVLGYCSQISSPGYKTSMEERPCKAARQSPVTEASLEPLKTRKSFIELPKESFEGKLCDRFTVTLAQTSQNSVKIEKQKHFPMYIANPQKTIAFASSKSQTKGSMILLNTTDSKGNVLRNRTTTATASLNLVKEETRDLVKTEASSSTENSSVKNLSFKTTKYYLDLQPVERPTESKERETQSGEDPSSAVHSGKTWSASGTSEIARILSEYNKSSTKKPAIENPKTGTHRFNLKDSRGKEISYLQASPIEKNVNIKFLPGKWRRFHFTVEKLKDAKISTGENSTEKLAKGAKQEAENREGKDCRRESKEAKENLNASVKKEKVASKSPLIEEREEKDPSRTETLQDLLENTAVLYCAAAGVHQDDLAEYIDGLDAEQSVQWLEGWKNSTG